MKMTECKKCLPNSGSNLWLQTESDQIKVCGLHEVCGFRFVCIHWVLAVLSIYWVLAVLGNHLVLAVLSIR